MQLMNNSKYRTANGQIATVLYWQPELSQFIGYIGHDKLNSRALLWDIEGKAQYSSDNIVGQFNRAEQIWIELSSHSKADVKALVETFRFKKITGIKFLRGAYGWGLSEAKDVFEGVADGKLR